MCQLAASELTVAICQWQHVTGSIDSGLYSHERGVRASRFSHTKHIFVGIYTLRAPMFIALQQACIFVYAACMHEFLALRGPFFFCSEAV